MKTSASSGLVESRLYRAVLATAAFGGPREEMGLAAFDVEEARSVSRRLIHVKMRELGRCMSVSKPGP